MFEPPPQLRVRTDLDGMHLTVSGQPWSIVPVLQGPVVQNGGWVLAAALCLMSCQGVPGSIAMAFLIAVALQVFKLLDPVRGATKTRITLTPAQLHVRRDEVDHAIQWDRVGLVTENGRSVEIRRVGGEAIRIPMELEPAEHSVWVAMTIDERAMEARQARGSVADVPSSIRDLRRPERPG